SSRIDRWTWRRRRFAGMCGQGLTILVWLPGARWIGGECQRIRHPYPCQCDHYFAYHLGLSPEVVRVAPTFLPQAAIADKCRLVRLFRYIGYTPLTGESSGILTGSRSAVCYFWCPWPFLAMWRAG